MRDNHAHFHVLLPLIAPVVDVFTVYGLIFLNAVNVIGFWTGFVLLQAIAGGYALRLDGERLWPLWLLPLQQVVYRQLMYLVTIQSVITALLGTRQRWQVIRRAGVFAGQPDASTKSPALPQTRRRAGDQVRLVALRLSAPRPSAPQSGAPGTSQQSAFAAPFCASVAFA
jgi:hypothetical protein